MKFTCPICKQPIEIDDRYSGRDVQCHSCGRYIEVPAAINSDHQATSEKTSARSLTSPNVIDYDGIHDVRVVNINIPFGKMVVLIIKLSLAAIPAILLMRLIDGIFTSIVIERVMSEAISAK